MKVTYKLPGGSAKEIELREGATLGDLKKTIGVEKHTASVNKDPADDSQELEQDDMIILSQAVKAG